MQTGIYIAAGLPKRAMWPCSPSPIAAKRHQDAGQSVHYVKQRKATPGPSGGLFCLRDTWKCVSYVIRDRSLITRRGGGATKWEKRGSETFCPPPPPPPARLGKTLCIPPFKKWKRFASRSWMTKTTISHVKTTPKPFVPTFTMAKSHLPHFFWQV